MILIEKILFLQNSVNLKDREFLKRYKIKSSLFNKWKSNSVIPLKKDILYLCKEFNLDVDDFMDDNSTLKFPLPNEHYCKPIKKCITEDTVLEDFPREDNSRYEEKD